MALAPAVQGATKRVPVITWYEADGVTGVDLTGATLTGKIREVDSGDVRAIAGQLTPDPDQVTNKGVFTWQYHDTDVATAGDHEIQFIATYAGKPDKTFITGWYVYPSL